jgi:predicted dehydrogenase
VRRIPSEFRIFDSFAPLQPVSGHTNAVLKVRVRFEDQPAIVEHLRGKGRVVVSALGVTEEALETPQLRTMLRRSLRRRNGEDTEEALGVAIVGYGPLGKVGYGHGVAVTNMAGLELAAVCDSNPARLEAARSDFPQLKCYNSAAEVAQDPQVKMVIIATPPSTHTELAMTMLQAGKHVVSEKPLSLTVREVDMLYETAADKGLVLTVNQNRRWDPDFLTIRRVAEAGLLGKVFNMETFVGSFGHPCREWHSEASISGGTEYDWGSHHIDWTLQLMPGMPKSVTAIGHKLIWHDVSNFDQVRVRMLWEDGREAEFVHSDVAAIRRPKFYIQGTEGTIAGYYRPLITERIEPGRGYVRLESHHAEAPAELTLMRYEFASGSLADQKLALAAEEPYAFHRNLADHLHSDDQPLAVTYESVRRVTAILEAAHESAERGGVPLAPPV